MDTDENDLSRYELNSWTQPIHLFVDGDETAVCGIGLEVANNQTEGESDFEAEKFPAKHNFNSVANLEHATTGEENHCSECWEEAFGADE